MIEVANTVTLEVIWAWAGAWAGDEATEAGVDEAACGAA